MEFPILIKAHDSYRNLLPKGGRQEVLMSAQYLLDGKSYRVVGTVKKSFFGKITDYNFLDFVVVDPNGDVVKDKELSKRVYFCFTTLSMLNGATGQIENSIHDNPSYFSQAINKYDEIIQKVRPVLKVFKHPETYYDERFNAFYDFLVIANETNILGDELARVLYPYLLKTKKHQDISVHEIEGIRGELNEFFKISDRRTLLILENNEVLTIINLILDNCRVSKDIDLSTIEQEVTLLRNIIKGSKTAMRNSMIKVELEEKRKVSVEEIIAILKVDYQKGTLVNSVTERQFSKQWIYGKGVKI